MNEELLALAARLAAARVSHAALAARVERARRRVLAGPPIGAFARGFLLLAVGGSAVSVLVVELARVLP